MCSIFMPMMRNLFCSSTWIMSPAAPFSTASGLTMERVRWMVFMNAAVRSSPFALAISSSPFESSQLCKAPMTNLWNCHHERASAREGSAFWRVTKKQIPRAQKRALVMTIRQLTCLWTLNLRSYRRTRRPHQRFTDFGWCLCHVNSGGLHGLDLLLRGSLPAGNDRSGVAHAASRRRSLPGDESDDRLAHILLDEVSRRLLGIAANLADHDDGFRLGVLIEEVNTIHEVGADDRVAANADGRGLSDAARRQLIHRLVGQRARARDDADVPFLVDVRGHDANLAPARRDDTRTVRPNQPRVLRLQELPDFHHVHRGNAFGYADDQRHTGIGCFHNGVRRARWRNENHCRVGSGLLDRIAHRVEDRPALVRCAALAGSHATHNLGAVVGSVLGVECSFTPRQSLHK